METIQLRLLKLGARVQELRDRIKISLLIVPGGTHTAAQFDLIGLRAPDFVGPVRSIENPSGSRASS